jgi:hypothetical protein
MSNEAPPAPGPTVDAPATRVVTYSVRPGEEERFREFQDRINHASGSFPGFQGLEVIAPGDDEPGQWVTIYRFRTDAQLTAWLESDERRRALGAAPDIFTSPPSEYTMSDSPAAAAQAQTIVASHEVIPGQEAEYHRALDALNEAAARYPGFQGVQVVDGRPGSHEVTVLIQFDTKEHMDRWLASPERAAGREQMYRSTSSHHHKVVATGFGSWFAFNAEDGMTAPAWKQAMVVVSALFPTVMILNMTVGRLLTDENLGMAPSVFIGNVLGTIALTWLMMPIVTRGMAWWLSPRSSARTTLLGVPVLLAVYAAEVALFSALNP